MASKFLNIGFGNFIASDRIIALVSPDSAPIKRLIQVAKEDGRVIDASCGRKTRSVIITDSDNVILSAIQVDTLNSRLAGSTSDAEGDPEEAEE